MRSVVCIMLLFVAFAVRAQEKIYLSLQDAQEYALEHNRTLENASLDIKRAEAARWQAIASMLPQVSAGLDYTNMMGYKMDFGMMVISMPPSASFTVTTAIALSGAQIVSTQVGNISKRMADISYRKSGQEITDQVKILYYSALVTEETLELLRENLESMKKLHSMAQSAVDVGVSEQTDADQLKVQVATMETSINATERSLEMVYNSLRLQLNLDANSEIELTQGLPELMNIDAVSDLFREEFDVNRNYNYQLLKASTDLAKKQIALTGWSGGPTFSIFHQFAKKQYFSDEMTMNMTPPNMFGISVKVPLFTSLRNTKSVQDARLSYRKQLNTLADTEAALKIQHRQLIYNLKSALEQYRTQKDNVEVARRVFENIALKYEYGVASALDVTNAGTNLIFAQNSYVQSLLQIVNAQISLEQLLNR
ncbi:MAG: TolC family protein [Bacteroidales bacterium]|nr:TolC family protein [Bacteroidales bacterium]